MFETFPWEMVGNHHFHRKKPAGLEFQVVFQYFQVPGSTWYAAQLFVKFDLQVYKVGPLRSS